MNDSWNTSSQSACDNAKRLFKNDRVFCHCEDANSFSFFLVNFKLAIAILLYARFVYHILTDKTPVLIHKLFYFKYEIYIHGKIG